MSSPTILRASDLRERVGEELGASAWYEVSQETIDAFADLTDDRQWIHLDRDRAAGSPFGGTIAHGLFTLSLGPKLSLEVFDFEGFSFGVNYGYNRVRFPAPLRVGDSVRMHARLLSVDDVEGGVQVVVEQTFEARGSDKPVCVAESLGRLYA